MKWENGWKVLVEVAREGEVGIAEWCDPFWIWNQLKLDSVPSKVWMMARATWNERSHLGAAGRYVRP